MTGRPWTGEVVGHRGAAGLAPENTLEGFETAIAAGADSVEMDVRRTEDQRAVVFHDPTLERFVRADAEDGPPRPVSHHTLAQLVRIDVGATLGRPGCFIPSLDDVLEALRGRVKLHVEVKGTGSDGLLTLDACVRTIQARQVKDDTILSSFHDDIVRQAQREAPAIRRALIVDRREERDFVALATELQCVGVHVQAPLVTEHLVARCRHAGLGLRAWTVNTEAEMRRLMDLRLDGIITDYPDRLRALAGT